jgi:hypothetical protein
LPATSALTYASISGDTPLSGQKRIITSFTTTRNTTTLMRPGLQFRSDIRFCRGFKTFSERAEGLAELPSGLPLATILV